MKQSCIAFSKRQVFPSNAANYSITTFAKDDATLGEPRNNSQMIYVGILRMRLDTPRTLKLSSDATTTAESKVTYTDILPTAMSPLLLLRRLYFVLL